ncbi:eukaryotic translation initiation factor 4E1-like [Condylostylus longicornis]|uniref:eukaryotic translation initiation factor 4E1-like n=1 Tax=Condylostylus longicornis TaxID=2530218 RepID=UPI00244E5120|nr:eukaryotic translation initiation factor 4E1-like [Condylostylus longicornis]
MVLNESEVEKKKESTDEKKVESETSAECLMKHPLQNEWTLWYLESDRTKSWEELQNDITSFETVEDFWSLYNHIKLASEVRIGSDYSLFKKGIRPMWEDEANIKGGRWVITLNRQQRKTELDNLWLDVLLCLIGETFEHSDQICGAVVNIRAKADKISVWTADGSNKEAVMEIGLKLKESLRMEQLTDKFGLVYQMHKDTMVKQGSGVKVTYTL